MWLSIICGVNSLFMNLRLRLKFFGLSTVVQYLLSNAGSYYLAHRVFSTNLYSVSSHIKTFSS